MSSVKRRRALWLVPDWLPSGKLLTLDGDAGLGKSTVLLDIAARVSSHSVSFTGEQGATARSWASPTAASTGAGATRSQPSGACSTTTTCSGSANDRYRRETPLREVRKALPRPVQWYADPSGPTEINEFRRAGYVVRKGQDEIRRGTAAVTAPLRTGRLRVCAHRCPNLLAEAKLYRYPGSAERALIGE
jgi:hypothetical protein